MGEAEDRAAAEATAAEAALKVKAAADAEAAKVPKFTQSDLDRVAGEARDQGRKTSVKEVLDVLGVADVEAAKAVIKAAKDAEEAQKTDLQKAQDVATAAVAERDKVKAEAQEVLVTAKLEGALRDAGCNPARILMALRVVEREALAVEGSTVKGVTEAVAALKLSTPEWFGDPKAGGKSADASIGRGAPSDDILEGKSAVERAAYYRKTYGIRI